jgi:hypothetical protein
MNGLHTDGEARFRWEAIDIQSARRPPRATMNQRLTWNPPIWFALPVLAIAAGALVAYHFLFALVVSFAAIALMALVRPVRARSSRIRTFGRFEETALLLLVGGPLVLGYGFANLGVAGSVPIPLAEILLVPLVIKAIIDRPSTLNQRFLRPLALLWLFTLCRLVIDLPTWGIDALRDATIIFESAAIFVGYWAGRSAEPEYWIGRLKWIFLAVFFYASLYPWRAILLEHSPVVGLQRDVPLLGSMAGVDFAVAAGLMFFACHGSGWRRILLIVWGAVLLAVFQARSLYIIVPAAALVAGWLLRKNTRLVVASLLIAPIALLAVDGLRASGIQGRIGPLEPSFYGEQLGTILGSEGAGAGSRADRLDWMSDTIERVTSSTTNTLFGLGFGPDLALGFRDAGEGAVRKPHNDLLEIFGRMGLVGLLLFLMLLARLVLPLIPAARRGRSAPLFAFILATATIYLMGAAVQPLLAFPYGAIPLFFLLGLGFGHRQAGHTRPRPDDFKVSEM